MTREELLDQVIRPWKEGVALEFRTAGLKEGVKNPWRDAGFSGDPISCPLDLERYEYRLKPRMVRYVIEVNEASLIYGFNAVANDIRNNTAIHRDIVEAIRNAKPMMDEDHK